MPHKEQNYKWALELVLCRLDVWSTGTGLPPAARGSEAERSAAWPRTVTRTVPSTVRSFSGFPRPLLRSRPSSRKPCAYICSDRLSLPPRLEGFLPIDFLLLLCYAGSISYSSSSFKLPRGAVTPNPLQGSACFGLCPPPLCAHSRLRRGEAMAPLRSGFPQPPGAPQCTGRARGGPVLLPPGGLWSWGVGAVPAEQTPG